MVRGDRRGRSRAITLALVADPDGHVVGLSREAPPMTNPDESAARTAHETGVTPEITDEYMQTMLGKSRTYTAMLLQVTERTSAPDAAKIIWEHGRRNFALRAEGKLPIICPATDESDWAGIGIFDGTPEEVERIMADDPGVKAGLFTYELHPVCGFPSSRLP
jgi:hypothetical protein